MDERDKDLTHLFVTDLDEIPLPPRGEWRRPEGRETIAMRTSRYLLTAGAIVAVLAIALIVGFQLRDRSTTAANPSPSPTRLVTSVPNIVPPSPTANPNVTPTPAVSASQALLSDRFGFLLQISGGFAIRSETGTTIGQLVGFAPSVSPDGRQVAYWQGSGPGNELRLVDPAKPNDQRTLLKLPATERGGGGILWSPDGAALVLPIWSADSFEGIDGGPKIAWLRMLNVSTGSLRDVAKLTSGRVLVPVAWDLGLSVIGAAETGAGGFMSMYDVIPVNANSALQIERQDVQGRVIGVQGSPDGKRVLGIWMDENTVHIWPTAIFGAAYPVGKGGTLTGARWRPGSDQVWWAVSNEVGWFIPQTSSSAVMYGAAGPVTIGPFRPDGSALVMVATTGATRSTVLVDATSINTVEALGPEPIAASVVLR